MQTIISQMLERYRADSLGEERNALKEVVQEVALCGLSRAGFFKSAAERRSASFTDSTAFQKIWTFL